MHKQLVEWCSYHEINRGIKLQFPSMVLLCLFKSSIIIRFVLIDMEDPIADFIQWYKSRPIITKTFLTLSTILSILVTIGYLSVHQIYYTF